MRPTITILTLFISLLMNAQPLPTVDVERYQGDWFLIGFKPSKLDRNWFNIKENYTWNASKNRFDVVATYKNESGGKQKSMREKLLPVANSNNAQWIARIGFFIRADYVIYKIADDYSYVVIGHPKQKYVYIMARIPQMEEALYLQLVDFAVGLGYKREEIKKDAKEYGI